MTRRIAFIVPVLAALLAASCEKSAGPRPAEAPPEKRHAMRGEVIRLDEKEKVAVIQHDEIKDFMEAMTMGFPVPDAAEFAKLKPGMKIRATVIERKDDFFLTAIEEEK
jgi:Cu/Ag efflux protein CusF